MSIASVKLLFMFWLFDYKHMCIYSSDFYESQMIRIESCYSHFTFSILQYGKQQIFAVLVQALKLHSLLH